jgi:ABC-2 type transport system permease protein
MMSRLWLVARHEYRNHVLNKGFVLGILSVPLFLVLIIGMGAMAERMKQDGRPVGYVDQSGWLSEPVEVPVESRSLADRLFDKQVSLLPYDSRQPAHLDLEAGKIQAYYVLAEDYLESRQVELVYTKPPGENATAHFSDFLQLNLLADQPPQIAQRALHGGTLIVRTPDGARELVEGQVMSILLPILLSITFMILFMSTSFTLLQAVVQEKDGRTMEILATSVSPEQLIGGKVLAVVGMGLTMFLSWIILVALGLLFAGKVLGVESALQIRIAPAPLAAIALVAIPSYVLYGGVMTALGSTVADAQESQQLGGLVSLLFMLPFYGTVALVEHPNSPLAIALTLFPFTSLTTFCLRLAFSTWPTWQLVASLVILTLCAVGSMWLAARAFRLGMLRYGKRLDWREVFQRTTAPRPSGAAATGGGQR